LQPHFIRSFFAEGFRRLGGRMVERERGRFEITRVPAELRRRDRLIGTRAPLLDRYERVTFERDLQNVPGQVSAELLAPGHPLLGSVIDLLLERDASALIQGTVLVDPNDRDTTPRVLVYLEHSIVGGRASVGGGERLVSKRFCFVETDEALGPRDAGPAPFLDYRAPTPEELAAVAPLRDEEWIRADLDHEVLGFAIAEVVPG